MIRHASLRGRQKIIGMYYDLYDVICNAITTGGFVQQKPLFKGRKQRAEVFAKDGLLVVVQGTYNVEVKKRHGYLSPELLQDEFEAHLKKVMHQIDETLSALNPPRGLKLILQGGGNLVLPKWFMDWAAQNDIEIIIINEENYNEQSERIRSM